MQELRKYIFISFTFFIMLGCNSSGTDGGLEVKNINLPDLQKRNDYYVSNRKPLKSQAFVKLPIGSIQPRGWLYRVLELQREGMTGHLGEISAWLEKENNAWLSPDGEGENGWEEVPYWLKGYGDLAYLLKDSAMIEEAKVWIEGALGSQREDGYFGPEGNRAGEEADLWPNMVMLWCLQSYYEYSHDDRVLSFMKKYFKWQQELPDSALMEDFWGNSRRGDDLYSIYWLYNRTGDNWLLDLAERIHKNTADWMQADNLPNWHNVNIAQGFREPAVYSMLNGDSTALQATYDNFNLVREKYGQVPGGMFGADENAREGYTGPQQAIETCGMVEQMNSDEILLQITGDPFWGDNLEDVAFNTYPAALTPDMKALRYFTAPNMVTSDSTNHHPGIENEGPFFMMNPLSNRCCQHNHTQGWPYYAENLWMATPDNGLVAILYSANEVTARVGNGAEVTIEQQTHYPFSDSIEFVVHSSENIDFPLYLRIPSWSKGAAVVINGQDQKEIFEPGSYARIEQTWKDGDKVTLHLPRELQVREWQDQKNGVSLDYGALTFSLKIEEKIQKADPKATALGDSHWISSVDTTEWPAYTILPGTDWNYGLVFNNNDFRNQFKIIKKDWPEDDYPFTPDAVPIEIIARGKEIPDWRIDKNGLVGELPQSPIPVETDEEEITLVPMGASRLRISVFPVVK